MTIGNTPEKTRIKDTDRGEQGAGHDAAAVSYFFVACIEDEIADLAQGSVAPGVELLVEFGRGAADLGAGHIQAAQFLHDLGDLAGGDALDVHLGDGHQVVTDAKIEQGLL